MALEVFTKSTPTRDPAVTIHKRGLLSLNGSAFLALGGPHAVALMFDRDAFIIGLRPTSPSSPDCSYVRRASRGDGGPFLISAMAFLRYYNVLLPQTLRWPADLVDGVLCVNLGAPGVPVTSNRARPQPSGLRLVEEFVGEESRPELATGVLRRADEGDVEGETG